MRYPFFKQLDSTDCGPACLRMVAKFYGKQIDEASSRKVCGQYRNGTTMLSIRTGAATLGFASLGVRLTIKTFEKKAYLPCIVQWNKEHFIVVYKITKETVTVGDPAVGILKYNIKDFCRGWLSHKNDNDELAGIALLLKPDEQFTKAPLQSVKKYKAIHFIKFLAPYKKLIVQLFFSLLIGSAVSLTFPFLTQSIVDIGIASKNISFIVYVLIGQLALNLGMCFNRYVSSWLILHISSRVSISMISFFLEKLMKLHIAFFDSKMIGDLLQRMQDFSRIENFLTSSLIGIAMAIVGVIVYSAILFKYGWLLLVIFFIGAVLYLAWIFAFKNKRRKLDYMRFQEVSENQSMIIHYIRGMQEIKLNNCENLRLTKWKRIQLKLYKINIAGLTLFQIQNTGGLLIDQTKNILISFISAYWVVDGSLTLGMLLAVSYIIGQLNGPLYEFSSFIQESQDAQISMERINEVNVDSDEEQDNIGKVKQLHSDKTIILKNVWFRYVGSNLDYVLKDISFKIPTGSVTAIVGESGSGKSTLLKLLLGFYAPTKGSIKVGDIDFNDLNIIEWRRYCSAVMQDGYLFTDTITNNIAIGDDKPQIELVKDAAKKAKIHEFISSLPLNYETKIGEDGLTLSGGQKQRVLIARVIYKNAPFVFLDEATNALDAYNENDILGNLRDFYKGKTVIIVAHRLSTIKNADNILVMKKGEIVERGTHDSLLAESGYYSSLMAKQIFKG